MFAYTRGTLAAVDKSLNQAIGSLQEVASSLHHRDVLEGIREALSRLTIAKDELARAVELEEQLMAEAERIGGAG